MRTAYGRLEPVERHYPSFNDSPHARPILSVNGTSRALSVFLAVLGSLGLLVLLAQLFG